MLQGLARGSTPLPAHRLPRHTNKTLQAYCQAYCRPPSLAISRHLAHAHSLACSKGSHGVRLPGRLIDSRYTPTKRFKPTAAPRLPSISSFSSGFPYSPLCPPPACICKSNFCRFLRPQNPERSTPRFLTKYFSCEALGASQRNHGNLAPSAPLRVRAGRRSDRGMSRQLARLRSLGSSSSSAPF